MAPSVSATQSANSTNRPGVKLCLNSSRIPKVETARIAIHPRHASRRQIGPVRITSVASRPKIKKWTTLSEY
jgi:hypothetical protein